MRYDMHSATAVCIKSLGEAITGSNPASMHTICAVVQIICAVVHIICAVVHIICATMHIICITAWFEPVMHIVTHTLGPPRIF